MIRSFTASGSWFHRSTTNCNRFGIGAPDSAPPDSETRFFFVFSALVRFPCTSVSAFRSVSLHLSSSHVVSRGFTVSRSMEARAPLCKTCLSGVFARFFQSFCELTGYPSSSCSRKLICVCPRMIWSRISIPINSPADSSRRVTAMSSRLGVGSPEG